MGKHKDSGSDLEILKIYFKAALQNKWTFLLALCIPLSVLLTSVAGPYLSSHILANLISRSDQVTSEILLLAVVYALGVIANRIGMVNLMTLQAKTMSYLHKQVFERLLERGTRYYSNQVSGKLISDVIDFVNSAMQLANAILLTGISFFITVFVGLIVVFVNSWQLGVFLLGFIVVIGTWTITESIQRSKLRNQRLVASKNLTSHLSDSITNIQTVKTFSNEALENKTSLRLMKVLEDLRLHDWTWTVKSGSSRMGVIFATQVLLILLLTRLSKTDPDVLATGIFAFTYTLTISNKLFDLNALTRQVEESLLQAQPIAAMLKEPIEVLDAPDARNLVVKNGKIDFSSVFFDYQEGTKDNAVFKNLDLHIKAGEKIGLVGSSGGGKSTLTRLLLRFEDIQAGEISIDDQNIAKVHQTSLRHHISYVPQEPLLFHRSILDNIRYGREKSSMNDIEDVARKAHAHDFIKNLPLGYDTLVGERGVKLSGGQKQRIAIARAMLKDAPILVLDEATSALDSESEVLIQDALWKLMKGRTVIAIAHRLSTIQKMDRILVLDDGAIIEEGTHKELVAKNGKYAKLWKHQSGGFLEE